VTILTVLNNQVVGFERLKAEYESCLDFQEFFTLLKSGTTREIDSFLLKDGYLFQFASCASLIRLRENL